MKIIYKKIKKPDTYPVLKTMFISINPMAKGATIKKTKESRKFYSAEQ